MIKNNDSISQDFVLKSCSDQKISNNGSKYYNLGLCNQGNSIIGRYFFTNDYDALDFDNMIGSVIHVIGYLKKSKYDSKDFINIKNIYGNLNVKPDELMKTVSVDEENDLKRGFIYYLDEIKNNQDYYTIINYLLHKYSKDFMNSPAGKSNHHNCINGLANHTLSILKLAKSLIENYDTKNIDIPLLYSGIILHDFGKIKELNTAPTFDYTLEGKMLGHIVIGDQLITEACLQNDIDPNSDEIVLLRAMVVQHHGSKRCGSPVEPMLFESEILHRLDGLDGMMFEVNRALDSVSINSFTNPVFPQGNLKYFKHI